MVWQLPERFHRDDDRLAAALERLAQRPPGRHAFEFRHPSWFVPEVETLLRAHGAALVIGDTPERPFQTHVQTADWMLVRFHYGRRGRRGNYAETELQEWARRLWDWAGKATVYAYFNNDWEGFAPRNALRLRALLRQLTERTGADAPDHTGPDGLHCGASPEAPLLSIVPRRPSRRESR